MELNYQDLKKYMTIVYELEEEICFQNELMAKLQFFMRHMRKLKIGLKKMQKQRYIKIN